MQPGPAPKPFDPRPVGPRPADPRSAASRPGDPRPVDSQPANPHSGDPVAADPFGHLAAELESVDGLPMAERVAVFTQIHAVLNEALSTTASNATDQQQQGRQGAPGGFRPGGR